MKYFALILTLIFLSAFYTKAQDSTATIQSYEKNIHTGLVIKRVGGALLIIGPLTLIFAQSDSNSSETVNGVWLAGLATTLLAIPITLTGRYIEKDNRKKLAKYRLTLGTTGNIPTIGIGYKF
jgi:hypothetical protein